MGWVVTTHVSLAHQWIRSGRITSNEDIQKGDAVHVVAVDGMRLTVRRATPQTPGGSDIWI